MRRTAAVWLLPTLAFAVLMFATSIVANLQVARQHALSVSYTESLAQHTVRGLELTLRGATTLAEVFATRWASHGQRDFSQTRFREFAAVLVAKENAFQVVRLFDTRGHELYAEPGNSNALAHHDRATVDPALAQALESHTTTLSAPFRVEARPEVLLVVPIFRDTEHLGFVAVDLAVGLLLERALSENVLTQFDISLRDDEAWVAPPPPAFLTANTPAHVEITRTAHVPGRRWHLTVASKPETFAHEHLRAALPVLLLGLFLSLGVAHMLSLLLRRIKMAQAARDHALTAERLAAALPRQILRAQEEERERVARELHDELGQLLTALRLELGVLQKRAEEGLGGQDATLENVIHIVEQGGSEVRRLCRGLRPPLLDDLGLEPAARLLIREFGAYSALQVDLRVAMTPAQRLSPELKLTTYRILQEALNNIAKHAQAKQVTVEIILKEDKLRLSVEDDGRGFSTAMLSDTPGIGLAGMSQRATLVDGELSIHSQPGSGTRIEFHAPVVRTRGEAAL